MQFLLLEIVIAPMVHARMEIVLILVVPMEIVLILDVLTIIVLILDVQMPNVQIQDVRLYPQLQLRQQKRYFPG